MAYFQNAVFHGFQVSLGVLLCQMQQDFRGMRLDDPRGNKRPTAIIGKLNQGRPDTSSAAPMPSSGSEIPTKNRWCRTYFWASSGFTMA